MTPTPTTPIVENLDAALAAFTPQLGNYAWLWSVLRWRARQTGYPPRRLYHLMKPLFNSRTPFFRGHTVDGVKFLGDSRDRYSLDCMVDPNPDSMADFVAEHLAAGRGAYLDVGTNLGLLAARVAQKLQGQAEVIAFEALPETARRAAATFALNDLSNIRLFPIALGDEDGEITFYNSPGNSDFASANPVAYDLEGMQVVWAETRVPCYRLSTLMEAGALPQVGLLKIDVEGNELRVLRGARELIARDKPQILFEYNFKIAPEMGWEISDVATLLTEIAPYRLSALYDDGTLRPLPSKTETTDWMKVDVYCEPI